MSSCNQIGDLGHLGNLQVGKCISQCLLNRVKRHTLAKLGNLSSVGILNSKSKVWHFPGLSVVYFLPAVGVANSCVLLIRVVLSPQPSMQPAKLTDMC